jgi:hypothetical protein
MAEDIRWKGRKTGEMNSPSGERLTWKGTGHVASSEWMMRRRENHVDQKERGEWMTHGSRGKAEGRMK